MNRRTFIRNASIYLGGLSFIGASLYWSKHRRFLSSDLYQIISPHKQWHSSDLLRFIQSLEESERKSLSKALEKNGDLIPEEILRELRWASSSVVVYPFKDKADFNYHELVQWTAKNLKNDSVESETTFSLEARMMEALFEELWDSLTQEQRIKVLTEIDKEGAIIDKAAIASLGGASALAALSATVYFTGFAFYTTMTTAMFTTAGFFGVTLPFAAYTSETSLVAVLSGPIGWAILAVATTAGIAMLGRANVRKTTAFVIQVHIIKIKKIIEAKQEKRFRKFLPNGNSPEK
jgi:uncharacterized protein YaaW (UPF0174 family)